jgi:2'-5' RNA ligase
LFIGVPLPGDAVDAVGGVVDEVRAAGLPAAARDVRWVRHDGLHVTLRFLGPTADALIDPTAAAVTSVARSAAGPLELELGRAGAFPANGRPRALWIGLTSGTEALTTLAGDIDDALVRIGWPPVDRAFRPHLTLARADGIGSGALVAVRLIAAMADRRIRCTVDRLGLFESVTGGGPARYVPVTLATLGGTS